MKKTIPMNTKFLDKLEKLFINNSNIIYVIVKGDIPEEKDNIYFSTGSINHLENKETYVKQFITYLKNPNIESICNFHLFVARKNLDNVSIHDYLVSLNPSDQDLLLIYSKIDFLPEDSLAFLALFKEKSNVIQALKLGNNNIIGTLNYFEFLEQCFNYIKKFQFSTDEYYDIWFNCIKNSKIIYGKDKLYEFFSQRINNAQLLESLHQQLFNSAISIDNSINMKSVEKIEITTLSLMRKYKFMTSDEIESLLCFFVECTTKYIDNLSSTFRIQYFKDNIDSSHLIEHNLIIETNNIEECSNLLDVYLRYFVIFDNDSDSFISNIKQKPHIFKNLILYNKLENQLENKNPQNEI